jgi:hypothetical protein
MKPRDDIRSIVRSDPLDRASPGWRGWADQQPDRLGDKRDGCAFDAVILAIEA